MSRHGTNFTPTPTGNRKTSTTFQEKLKAFPTFQQDSQDKRALSGIQNIGVERKRRLEDLFGDICDIEEEEINMKKHKI
jgi:hypothetical protein